MDRTNAKSRKDTPIYSGVLNYFPLALAEVARCSKVGNDQHNPGLSLRWDREKSGDELDALTRHLMDAGEVDTDGIRHSTKVAWRALANLQKELELAEENTYSFGDSDLEKSDLVMSQEKLQKIMKNFTYPPDHALTRAAMYGWPSHWRPDALTPYPESDVFKF